MSDQSSLPANVAAPSPGSIAKAALSQSGDVLALIPTSLDDAYRLSKALAASGDMVPKHFQEKPDAIMAAILRGLEIGLKPMQALSNIAVINGRASLWGDAIPALMARAGHQIDVEVDGEGDKMLATATLIRGDTGQRIVRSFGADDAKAAGLWGKAGPWQQYKARMLSMRARSLACRDGAADALMGLQIAEEVQEYPRDITPKQSGFQRMAAEARGQITKPADDDGAHGDEVTGDAYTMDSEHFAAGHAAGLDEASSRGDCIELKDPEAIRAWMAGFDKARMIE